MWNNVTAVFWVLIIKNKCNNYIQIIFAFLRQMCNETEFEHLGVLSVVFLLVL
jgi:hypothetical protein